MPRPENPLTARFIREAIGIFCLLMIQGFRAEPDGFEDYFLGDLHRSGAGFGPTRNRGHKGTRCNNAIQERFFWCQEFLRTLLGGGEMGPVIYFEGRIDQDL